MVDPEPTYQIRRVKPDGTAGPWLNDYVGFTFTDIWNQPASLTVDYPHGGAHQLSHLTLANFSEVAVFTNREEVYNGRFMLDEIRLNPYRPQEVPRQYTGASIVALTEWTRLWLSGVEGDELVYTTQTPGAIILSMVSRFDSLWSGVLNPARLWSVTTFSGSVDAISVPWATTTTMTLARGYSLLQLISDLQENGQIFVRTLGREILPYRNDYGSDLTTGPDEVNLIRGRDIVDGEVSQSSRDLVTATGGATAGNLSRWWVSGGIIRDNMVREEYIPDSNTGDVTTRDQALQKLLDDRADNQRQITLELNLRDVPHLPHRDYVAGDVIWIDAGEELGRIQAKIVQITLVVGRGGIPETASIVLNTYFDKLPRLQAKFLRQLRFGRLKLPA